MLHQLMPRIGGISNVFKLFNSLLLLRAHGLAAMTSPLQGEDHRFDSGWAHYFFIESNQAKSIKTKDNLEKLFHINNFYLKRQCLSR